MFPDVFDILPFGVDERFGDFPAGEEEIPAVTYDRTDVLDGLLDAFLSAKQPNWDGEGGHPVSREALRNAGQFLQAMPVSVPHPEIDPAPMGSLIFSWYFDTRRRLVVSIDAIGKISYAALQGSKRTKGSFYFDGDFPEDILRLVAQIRK